MNTPIGMVGAAVLFWGWQTGWLLVAAPLALAIEARVFWRPAWELDAQGINRCADLSSLALVGVGAWFLITLEAPRAARTVMGMAQWLPVTLAPLALAQAYLARSPFDLSVLFVTLRNRPSTGLKVDFGFVYVIACVLASATANVRNEMFYAGAVMLAAWSLWNLRSRRYPRVLPFAMLITASVLGYAGHQSLNYMQGVLAEWVTEAIGRSVRANPFRTHTDIGHIGELKESQRVLLRVRLPEAERTPLLLHRASYNVFASPAWIARPVGFEPVTGDAEKGWALLGNGAEGALRTEETTVVAPTERGHSVEVLEYSRNGKTILSLPTSTVHIAGLPPAEVRRSAMGSINIETVGGFIRYRAERGAAALVEAAPTDWDVAVPAREMEAVAGIAMHLGLKNLPPEEARRRIERFFAENFRYTTWLEASPKNAPTALAAFLTRTRAGHCEYFASATVLLLREAGIPARYATGFSVQERASNGEYLVRERHAHAWVRAYLNGAWTDIDTTPPQWIDLEAGESSLLDTLSDSWAWLRFAWGRYQTAEDAAVPRPVLLGLMGVLFAVLVWRILRGPSRRRVNEKGINLQQVSLNGTDSEFFQIEKTLAERGFVRGQAEPLGLWLARLARAGWDTQALAELRAIVNLHYQLRFDPRPMRAVARRELGERVTRWLATQPWNALKDERRQYPTTR